MEESQGKNYSSKRRMSGKEFPSTETSTTKELDKQRRMSWKELSITE